MLLFDDPSITMSLFHDPPHYCGLSHAMAGHGRPFLWSKKGISLFFLSRRQLPRLLQAFQEVLLSLQSLLHGANGAKLWPDLQKCPWSKRVPGGCRSHVNMTPEGTVNLWIIYDYPMMIPIKPYKNHTKLPNWTTSCLFWNYHEKSYKSYKTILDLPRKPHWKISYRGAPGSWGSHKKAQQKALQVAAFHQGSGLIFEINGQVDKVEASLEVLTGTRISSAAQFFVKSNGMLKYGDIWFDIWCPKASKIAGVWLDVHPLT